MEKEEKKPLIILTGFVANLWDPAEVQSAKLLPPSDLQKL